MADSTELVLYEVRDAIAMITLNRPEKRNALSRAVWRQLDAAWGWEIAKSNQMSISGHAADFFLRREGEKVLLLFVPAISLKLDSPDAVASIVGQLGEWNANLGRPSKRVDGHGGFPHRIPRQIQSIRPPGHGVSHGAAGSHAKKVPGEVVVP